MRTLKLMLLSFTVIFVIACSDEETNVEKYYEGGWIIRSNDPEVDSVSNIFVQSSGDFTYDLNYGGGTEKVIGIVKETGDVRANIKLDTILLGISRGKFYVDGTGSGEYTIVNQTFKWTATKK